LFVLIITNFVDMVGVLMIIPLLPFYTREMGGGSLSVAVLMVAFTAAQLLSAPLWGRFSDRYGRRPALLVGLTASAIAYVVFAYANSVWLLLLSRVVQGAGGGTVGVIQAYVADSVEPENRAKALGWLSAATNVGVAIGPAIGGAALVFGRSGPGLAAAALCLVNIFFAWRFLRESRDMTEAHDKKPRASRTVIAHVITHPNEPAHRLIWIYAIAMGAFAGLMAILALFLADQFGVGKDQIWIFYTYVGVISVVTRAGILGRMVDRYGEAQLSRIGLVLLATGLATLPLARGYFTLAIAVALIPLGTAFTFPCVTSMLSRVISSRERGLYMGVQQTFGGLSRVIVPLWAGFSYDHFGKTVPMFTSAALVFGTIMLGVGINDGRKETVPVASP
jgi:MFS family permease